MSVSARTGPAAHWLCFVFCLVLAAAAANAGAQDAPAPAPAAHTDAPSAQASDDASSAADPSGPIIHRGSGDFTAAPASPATPAPAPDALEAPRLDLSFDSAPIALVVQSLLSDIAGASVVIDPRVTGDITIHSQGQLTAAELPAFLRSSVAALGLELVEQAPNAYLLRPGRTAEDGATPQLHRPGAQTFSGLVIYGLQHVSAQEMSRLLQPFVRQGVTVTPEPGREMLVIAGPPDQVQSLISTIELLDADWLAGISLGVAPLEYAEPQALITELQTLFGGANGPIGSMVEFVPLASRRAILILAKRPERLDQARLWISQLDRPLRTGGGIRFVQLENAIAKDVAETLGALFGAAEGAHVRITADDARNALLVQSDPATFTEISALVAQLDTPADQVLIEATIAEVVLNNDFRFGVQWSVNTRDGGLAVLSEANNGGVAARFPGFSYGYTGDFVRAALNALASRTQVEVISSPVVITLDNQEALLQVGDEVPIVTQSAASVATPEATVVSTVQYRETGILLRVTPRISANGRVTMEVVQEASEVAATTTSGIDSPTIQQRRIESTVTIEDGETVALGGLIRANRTRSRSGVPFLGAVPLLGAAFRNSNNTVRRTELIVFLTPRVIRSPEQAQTATDTLAERLERIRASTFIETYRQPD